jgi:hypothetical protein
MNQHDVQLVEQALIEISAEARIQIFLVGTTNYLDRIDPRIFGAGFSERSQSRSRRSGYRKLVVSIWQGPPRTS